MTAVAMGLGIAGCAGVAPTLTNVASGFYQNVVNAASRNYNAEYGSDVQTLLALIAADYFVDKSGLERQRQQAAYPGQPQPGYGGQPYPSRDPYRQPGAYPQDPYQQPQDPYASQDPYQQQQSSAAQDPYRQDPYRQPAPQDPYQQSQDPYASQDPYQQQQSSAAQDPYRQDPYRQPAPQDPYAAQDPYQQAQGGTYAYRGAPPPSIAMDVALLAQRRNPDGSIRLEPVEDGAVLQDGRGDPVAGDKIKVFFRVNCACHVYIIGTDATGYVTRIFPDPDTVLTNPVQPGREYLLPEGTDWWGLDEQRGVEQIHFLASFRPRPDIEEVIARLAQQPRDVPDDYQAVTEPAIIPDTRGLVKVSDAQPVRIQSAANDAQEVTPTAFLTTAPGIDLAITRWFEHR
ncbi:MAG: DUF4384 domain-containing protein [Chromatiales bacterium]|nr:MAG: DUF4384 domain-containing protein [Chromatiales bacterium]